jgi:nucleotide-binding universal stress UspA family protein
MIKDVVVHLSAPDSQGMVSDFAISVANRFEAHLSGIAFAYQPEFPTVGYGEIPAEYIDGLWAESRRRASASIDAFNEATRRAGLLASSRQVEADIGSPGDAFARIARRFDLSIVKQAERGHAAASDSVPEVTLFGSGRPVMIVPFIQKDGLKLDRVTVCWDGSRTAARAVADALPFLVRAAAVDVLIVEGQYIKSGEVSEADIGQHLARHGLKPEIRRVVAREIDVASAILSHAAEISTDLIVMGGYGHSRMREFILGGATRGILTAMTVPVLMSH